MLLINKVLTCLLFIDTWPLSNLNQIQYCWLSVLILVFFSNSNCHSDYYKVNLLNAKYWCVLNIHSKIFNILNNIFLLQFRNFKIVYRRYAGLYFCICVDVSDNNLMYLEAIHNFVEVLNEYFHNVCELDLVFNFYKVKFCLLMLWKENTVIDISWYHKILWYWFIRSS